MRIAIIGSHNIILGFKALGADAFTVKDEADVNRAIDEIKEKNNYGIVFITEDFMDKAKEKLEELEKDALPAIVPIPSHIKTGAGLRNLKKIVERAVGSDILFK